MSRPASCRSVGVELGVQADAPPLLPQVQQVAAGLGDPLDRLAQLRAAVASLAAEHVAGQALAVQPDQGLDGAGGRAAEPRPVAEAEREVLAAVDQPVEGEHARGRGEPVGEPQRHRHLRPDRRRGAAAGASSAPPRSGPRRTAPTGRSATGPRPRSAAPRPAWRAGRGSRGTAVADEAAGPRVADEERRHDQVQLVGEPAGEELGVHRPAALDHQPPHAAGVRGPRSSSDVDRLAAIDHSGHVPEPSRAWSDRGAGAVDDLLGVAGGEEPGATGPAARVPVTVTLIGDRRQPVGDPLRPAGPASGPAAAGCRGGPSPRRPGSRRTRPHRVDPVEVGVVGQQQRARSVAPSR